jgi:ATP-dependent DNA helicase RecQ
VEMKTWIHLYFNSKYARKGYCVEFSEELIITYRVLKYKQVDGESGVYNASLLDWSEEGKESNFDWIIDFVNITQHDPSNSQKDNLKHLRGACTRLLIPNPDNYVFRLLRAFSLIVLEEDRFKDRQIQNVSEDLESGFLSLWSDLKGDQKKFNKLLQDYRKHVEEQISNSAVREGFEDHLEKIIFLSHVEWTKQFSQYYTANLITENHE